MISIKDCEKTSTFILNSARLSLEGQYFSVPILLPMGLALSNNCKVLTKSNLTAHIGLEVFLDRQQEYYKHKTRG